MDYTELESRWWNDTMKAPEWRGRAGIIAHNALDLVEHIEHEKVVAKWVRSEKKLRASAIESVLAVAPIRAELERQWSVHYSIAEQLRELDKVNIESVYVNVDKVAEERSRLVAEFGAGKELQAALAAYDTALAESNRRCREWLEVAELVGARSDCPPLVRSLLEEGAF